jgi:hypothetical protein
LIGLAFGCWKEGRTSRENMKGPVKKIVAGSATGSADASAAGTVRGTMEIGVDPAVAVETGTWLSRNAP